MNEPDFTAIIAARQREAEKAKMEAIEAQKVRDAEKKRQAVLVTEVLQAVVKPVLEKAAADLEAAGIRAEIGNGKDKYGSIRLSLRVFTREFPPALTFTACLDGVQPFLGQASEFYASPKETLPGQVSDLSQESIVALVGEFLGKAI